MSYGRDILLLSIVFLVCSLALNLISPIWPIYITELNASMTELGFVFSVSNAFAAGVQILSGFLSDKYGRRKIHALGTLLAAFPPLMYALANNWVDLVPWAMLSGFATGLYIPIRWAIVADASANGGMASAYGWTNISWLIGSTVAPFLGGAAADALGIRFPFFACFILILSVFPLTLLMRETRRKPLAKAESVNDAGSSVARKYLFVLVMFSLINIIQGVGIGATGPVISVFARLNFNLDYTLIGILYAIGFGVASIVVQLPGGKCSDRFDRRKVMFWTFLVSSPFFLLFAYSRSFVELVLFMFLSNALLNMSWPAFQTLMMDSTPQSRWGFVNGVSATTFWVGLMIGNALSGVLWDAWGQLAPFYASAVTIGVSAVLPLFLEETRAKKKNGVAIQK
ncbi:MAG: MFS transporter [Candidatus Bathyarchaeia archaeon]